MSRCAKRHFDYLLIIDGARLRLWVWKSEREREFFLQSCVYYYASAREWHEEEKKEKKSECINLCTCASPHRSDPQCSEFWAVREKKMKTIYLNGVRFECWNF